MRSLRTVLHGSASILASLALLTAAVAVSSPVTAAAAAASSNGGWLSLLLQNLGGVLAAVTGAGGSALVPTAAAAGSSAGVLAAPLGRLVLWLLSAGVCWLLQGQVGLWEGKLLHGDYPPPRNMDRM